MGWLILEFNQVILVIRFSIIGDVIRIVAITYEQEPVSKRKKEEERLALT